MAKQKSTLSPLDRQLVELLFKRQAELNSLLELHRAIDRNAGIQELLEMLHTIMQVHVGIRNMCVFRGKEKHFYKLSAFGEDAKLVRQLPLNFSLTKSINLIQDEQLKPLKYYVPILYQHRLIAVVLVGEMKQKQHLINHELQFIQTIFNVVFAEQENKKLMRHKRAKERLEQELELGRQVQQMLIPNQSFTHPMLEMGAWYQPHDSIGGDYFDFAQVNDDEVMWCIADVSGKGISAALLMANLQAGLRAWFAITSDPREITQRLNEFIWKNTRGDRYITLFLGVYHTRSGELQYVNAGHQPPMLFQKRGCQLLKTGTVMLGAFDELPFLEVGNARLASSDMIFNYTDGLVERKNMEEHLAAEQIIEYLCSRTEIPLSELHASLLQHISDTLKAKAPVDDLTLLSVRIK